MHLFNWDSYECRRHCCTHCGVCLPFLPKTAHSPPMHVNLSSNPSKWHTRKARESKKMVLSLQLRENWIYLVQIKREFELTDFQLSRTFNPQETGKKKLLPTFFCNCPGIRIKHIRINRYPPVECFLHSGFGRLDEFSQWDLTFYETCFEMLASSVCTRKTSAIV